MTHTQREYNRRETVAYRAHVAVHGAIRGGQKAFRSVKRRTPLSRRPEAWLSPNQNIRRETALRVLSQVRRFDRSLSATARANHTAPSTAQRYMGAFRKRGARWRPTARDSLPRRLTTLENGRAVSFLVRDSRTATLLGRYYNAVRYFMRDRDPNHLAEFENTTYIDAAGVTHNFETSPSEVVAIHERSEALYGVRPFYSRNGDETVGPEGE